MSGLVDETHRTGTGSGLATATVEGSARRADARRKREAARVRVLSRLMRERDDLAGVYEPADFAAEVALWCV